MRDHPLIVKLISIDADVVALWEFGRGACAVGLLWDV